MAEVNLVTGQSFDPVLWQRASDLGAFVLAGGRSTRMGRDKAFLELAGCTLLDRALDTCRPLCPTVGVVGPREKLSRYGAIVEDIFPNRGPLGAIHAALSSTPTSWNLVLGVDLPFIQAGFLRYLVEQAWTSGADVTVPRAGGGFHPVCAVYHRRFRDVAQAALERGENKVDALFSSVPTRIVEESELAAFALGARMFENLNTRQDFERAERCLAEQER
ncbi:MAG: molybdenum cofactor guanylyltransferase [Acidobacteria bacterium]|nr:molybdenum cofactor guanylyltransferase [Acidobacteriota bacterium]